jgi:hypothetical protein
MRLECERHQRDILEGAAIDDHVRLCDDCRSFAATERWLAPPDDLVARTVARLQPALLARAASRREIFWRLSLAGVLSLPIIITLNAAIVWMAHETIARLASPEIAVTGASIVAASLLLALSVAYGSLPLLASWGVRLRERTT